MAAERQRALVLQGGGALGAYEAGVIKALAKKLAEEDKKNGFGENRPLFDVVAGASIGAVNAAILVCHAVNRLRQKPKPTQSEAWQGAVDALEDFWLKTIPNYQVSGLDDPAVRKALNQLWDNARDYRKFSRQQLETMPHWVESLSWPYIWWHFLTWPGNFGPIAGGESIRRYYSYQAALNYGIPNVLTGAIPQFADMKFLNPFTPFFWRFDNTPLVELLKRSYWLNEGTAIQTGPGEPRLLLVAVDVQDCSTAVTFDSYPKEDGRHFSEYGGRKEKHVIEYDGVTLEHVLASMSTHQRYEFPSMTTKTGEKRYFWDGAYLSNTPLREVLQLHREYWSKIKHSEQVPELEVYIVNLYPSIEKHVPDDPDSIQDREVDVKFHDRTKYDLKVAEMTTDYVDLIKEMRRIAEGNKEISKKFRDLLDDPAKSNKRDGNPRLYRDLLDGRFRIARKVYVEREDDENTIFGKAFDFSYTTLKDLYDKGRDKAGAAYDVAIKEEKEKR
jgi:NTE family protein